MIKKTLKYSYLLLTLFLCSNRCAKEGTNLHIYNSSKLDIVILSKGKIKDSNDGFVSFKTNDRTIRKSDDSYLSFDEFEMEKFKYDNENYIFFIFNNKDNFLIIDSIKINKKELSLNEDENCIYYD